MLKINTNLSSLIVQSNLQASTLGLNQAIERMTSGFKINHAKDNAANFSFSTSLSTQLSSYMVAQDNTAYGLDMLTTAMDSLSLMSDHISRIRDLTEQAANGTYGQTSLNAIQQEINARLAECARIVSNTEYNGVNLLNEDDTVGFVKDITPLSEEEAIAQGYTVIKTADELQAINNNLSGKYILMNDIDLEGYNFTPIGKDVQNGFLGEFNGNGYVIRNFTSDDSSSSGGLFKQVYGGAKVLNVGLENVNIKGGYYTGGLVGVLNGRVSNCYVSNGTVYGSTCVGGLVGQVSISAVVEDSYANVDATGGQRVGGLVGQIYSGTVRNSYALGSVYGTVSDVGGLIGALSSPLEVSNCYTRAKVSAKTNTRVAAVVYTTNPSARFSNISYYGYVNEGLSPFAESYVDDGSVLTTIMTPPGEIKFQVGIDSSLSSQISLNLNLGYSLSVNVSSSSAARNSLARIDEALSMINSKQTDFGTAYNRLESALESISVSIENLTSTRSTIRDADIAEESSAYIRNQILQQASATLLATANQTPSIALQLL